MTVCLSMIVKDEARVIRRCLEAVRPLIDAWCIVDTGSTDDTEREIREALEGIPGELHHRQWNGFGDARTAALNHAIGKADYALAVDADELVSGELGILHADAHTVTMQINNVTYPQPRLFRLAHGFRFEGVLHEYATADKPWSSAHCPGLRIVSGSGGSRSANPAKYANDARVLAEALVADPLNDRYVFYLAQSWRDARDDAKAAHYYQLRASMGPGLNGEEVYVSLLEAGRALERLGEGDRALALYQDAYALWPARAEATRELARVFAHRAATSPCQGTLFVET